MSRFARKYYWLTVLTAAVLPGVFASIVEFGLTKGVSGWIPIVAAAVGGLASVVAMRLLNEPHSSEEAALLDTNIEASQSLSAIHEDKVLSRRTPAELADLVNGLTEVAAKHASEPHLGLWLMVEASVDDVSERSWRETLTVQATDSSGKPNYSLDFDADRWGPILRTLKVGDHLSAIGRIESLRKYGSIWLEECELLK